MKMKKWMALLVAMVLMIGLGLTGCQGGDSESKSLDSTESSGTSSDSKADGEDKEEPTVFTVFIGDPKQQPTKDNKIYKKIEEELNIKFEFEFLVGDLDQKLGVMIAGGDYPDLVDSANSTEKSINGGVYIPLQDFITEADTPNLWKQYSEYMNLMRADDGNVYVLPNYGRYYNDYIQTSYNGPAFWIQKAVLIDLDYPEIKTLDQYFDVIETYKSKYPDVNGQPTVGFEILTYDWRAFTIKNPPAQLLGNPNDGGVIVNPDTHIARVFANTDEAKPYYAKLNEAYNKGIIEADTFVQNYDEYLARLSTGSVLGFFDQGWQFQPATDSLTSQGLHDKTWVPLGITYDKAIAPYYRDRLVLNIDRGIGISVDGEYPKKYIELVETLLSDEWSKIFTWGFEGEDYMVDEDGMFYRTPEQRANAEDVTWVLSNKADALYASIPKIQGTFDDGNAVDANSQPSEYFDRLKDLDKEILEAYGHNYYSEFLGEAPENRKDYPAWQVTLGDGTEAAIADTKISELQLKFLPQLILGSTNEFDTSWDNYIKEYEKVDVNAYEERINEGIQELLSVW